MLPYIQDMSAAQIPQDANPTWDKIYNHAPIALDNLRKLHSCGKKPFLNIAQSEDDLTALLEEAEKIRQTASDLVVVGMGGSSLGARALAGLAGNDFADPTQINLHTLDNADPFTLAKLLKNINPQKTFFLVISKSGNTVEVLSNTLMLLDFMREKIGADKLNQHFLFVVQPPADPSNPSPLHQLSHSNNIRILEHNPEIGGRYSILSLVGLLPAACLGIDIRALRAGAKAVMENALQAKNINDCPPLLGAAWIASQIQQNRLLHVLMPYGDRPRVFASWWQQLAAESLGKQGRGLTPLSAVGAVDQHSLLQLFLAGPDDKSFSFIASKFAQSGNKINLPQIPWLNGRSVGEVMEALQHGTIQSTIEHKRPVRIFQIEQFDAKTMGALLMHMMLEVVLIADFINIDPYDQPAVEDGKILARQFLENI